jgi:serine/threonine-protein kinase
MGAVGHGGLGTVYQVSDTIYGNSNIYALKEQWDQSASARKQFLREGAWLQSLNHNHIPKVLDSFEWVGRLYLVMDFVGGENLEQKLEHNGGRPLPESEVIPWVRPICDALQYLHTRSTPIIHRDVKPANIIVTLTGHTVLVDLGIAKEHAPGANATATFVRKAGTEGYAAPEQYSENGRTGPWSDVYGLGATLYHLLTAHIPPTAVERVALDVRLRPPHELNPSVTTATGAAILRALAIRPQDRFQSMLEFKQALPTDFPASAAAPLSPPASTPYPSAPRPILTLAEGGAWPAGKSSRPPGGAPRPISRAAGAPARASTLTPPTSSTTTAPRSGILRPRAPRRSATPSGASTGAVKPSEARSRVLTLNHPVAWGVCLAAVVLIAAVAIVLFTRAFAPLDRSNPTATANGYFSAVQTGDFARAWQYMTASERGQIPESQFDQGLRADDNLYGHVMSATLSTPRQDAGGTVTITVSVVRALSATPIAYSVVLNQYGGLWLIDFIN